MNIHRYGKRESAEVAMENEFWANPHYVRRYDLEEEE